MQSLARILAVLAAVSASGGGAGAAQKAPLPTGLLGFNSGNTFADTTAKQQADFEAEFRAAQALHWSPGLFNSARLYTMVQAGTQAEPLSAFAAALATNTSLLLGIWCSGTADIDNELKALRAALDQHGQAFADLVVGISVGSEDLYRVSESGIANKAGVGQDAATIVSFIGDVRAALRGTPLADKPVGHVDSWSAWANTSNRAVAAAVDFVGTDLYPYYEKDRGNAFANATAVFDDILSSAQRGVGTNKTIWVTETGWPDSGPAFGDAEAGRDHAAAYWQEVGCGRLFGRTNTWWYNLHDSNPDNEEKFAVTDDLAARTHFNLSCRADSGAPAAINKVDDSGAATVGGPGASGALGVVVLAAAVAGLVTLS